MNKVFKYKLMPNKEQILQLEQVAGSCRWIWNYMLEQNKIRYEQEKKFIFKHEMIVSLPELKKQNVWLNEVSSITLQQKCIDLDKALKNCFKSGFGFPKFKSKHHNNDTFRIPQVIANKKDPHIKPIKKQIKIPKIGWIKWIRHRPLEGKLKSITIKKENDIWWCICLCEIKDVEQTLDLTTNDFVGIDLGLTDFAITSEGTKFTTPKFYRQKQRKLKLLQRKYSKKLKGSKNKEKSRKKINKLHLKIKNQRNDFTHKTSTAITKQYRFIGVEDLNIKGMTKNRRLSKSITDQGWKLFINQLEYKSKWQGGLTTKIDRFAPSSKTCNSCGNKQEMPLSERTYKCLGCGLEIDRDINAAINIKNFALKELNRCGTHRIKACGDTTNGLDDLLSDSYVSLKQEKLLVA